MILNEEIIKWIKELEVEEEEKSKIKEIIRIIIGKREKNMGIIRREELEEIEKKMEVENKKAMEKVIKYIKEKKMICYKHEWRVNQKEVFMKTEEKIETGIICQMTGLGKSYIILNYCQKYNEKTEEKNKIIVIFTERISILSELFSLEDEEEREIKYENWIRIGIINMYKFKVIERVIDKKKENLIEELRSNENKMKILIINRAFLTKNEEMMDIENIGLIIHDECHNMTNMTFKFLEKNKKRGVQIIGLSATPIKSYIDDEYKMNTEYLTVERIRYIYGMNLISNYGMIRSIKEGLIEEPKIEYYEYMEDKRENIDNIYKIIEKNEEGRNNKMIMWCGTIENANNYYDILRKDEKYRRYKIYKDHSEEKDKSGYEEYRIKRERCILVCASKHREGSDIKMVDTCIFMDKTKKRNITTFIQCIGRIIRKEEERKKSIIIDYNNGKRDEEKKINHYYNYFENNNILDYI